jgi:hypothetical protein
MIDQWIGIYVLGRKEMHLGFWLEKLRKRDDVEGIGVAETLILKWILMLLSIIRCAR